MTLVRILATGIFSLLLLQSVLAQVYPYTRVSNTGMTRVTQIRRVGSYLYANCFRSNAPLVMAMCRTSSAEGFVFNTTLAEPFNSYDGYSTNVGTNSESFVFAGGSQTQFQAGSAASVLQGEIGRQHSAVSSVEQNFIGTVVATHFAYTNQSANQIHYHLLFAQNRTWMLQKFNVSGTETSSQGWAIETATSPDLQACLGLISPGDVIMRAAPYLNPTRLFLFVTGRAERNGQRCPNYYHFTLFDRFRVDAGSSTFDAVSPAGQVTYWINGRQRCILRLIIENGDSFLSCGSRSETWNAQALAVKEDSYSILYAATSGWIFAHPFMSIANSSIPLEDMVVDSMIALDNQLLWTATDVFGNSYTYLADYNSFAASWNHTTVTPTADSRSVDLFPEMLGFMIAFIVCAVFMVIGWTLFIVFKVRMSRTRVSRVELNERLISSN